MRLLNLLGNIPLARSYGCIKAISKKKEEIIQAEREAFIKGCQANGMGKADAETQFERISGFAGYGFNKAHSTRYAVIAYQTAYMKHYYPAQFMAALLTFEMINTEKVVEYIQEASRMGLKVLPPDVNASGADFTVVKENGEQVIRFGLAAVKGVGAKAARCDCRSEKGQPVHVDFRFLLPRRSATGQPRGHRCADQVRRVRFNRRQTQSHVRGARTGAAGRRRRSARRPGWTDEFLRNVRRHQRRQSRYRRPARRRMGRKRTSKL